MRELTPTSYALLALLSLRDWSAYEMTGYMRGSTLRAIWPRAESHIYAEVKQLEQAGLASSTVASQGGRKRSIYTITQTGRDALGEWVVEPSRRFVYESEAMLKVAHADQGGVADLRVTIEGIRNEALRDLVAMAEVFDHIVNQETTPRLPDRKAFNALVSRFTVEMVEARLRWVEFADKTIADWSSLAPSEEREERALASYAETLDRVKALLERLGPPKSQPRD